MASRFILISLLAASLAGCSCSDDTDTSGGGGTHQGGTNPGGGSNQGGAGGGAVGGQQSQGGAGAGGDGGAGGVGFGPCHGLTDDFTTYDASSLVDYWAHDGDTAHVTSPDGAVRLTIASSDTFFAGIHSDDHPPAQNCFASFRIESGGAGGIVVFQVVEGTGSGPMVSASFQDSGWSLDEILNAQGDGLNVASGSDVAPEAVRAQLLPGTLVLEARFAGSWTELGAISPPPAWIDGPIVFGIGQTNAVGETMVVDDFNLDAP